MCRPGEGVGSEMSGIQGRLKSCVDVFGSFEVTDLVLSLEKEGCKVFSMVERTRVWKATTSI